MDNTAGAVSRGKILVVEDDPAAARFATYVLGERGGFHVCHLTDPVVAVQRIAEDQWDLVIADLDLPHMSGFDLLASVRRIDPGLPVVMTSARAMEAAPAHALLSHADAFLAKPIRSRRLIVVATVLIARRRARAVRSNHAVKPIGPIGPPGPG